MESKEPCKKLEYIDNSLFTKELKKHMQVVATSESLLYADVILKKGVVV